MIEIRKAKVEDINWIIGQVVSFANFYASKISLAADEEHGRKYLENIINHHVVLISEKEDGTRTGFIAGAMVPHHFNPKIRTLCELLWWVPEEYRGTKSGSMLLDKFIEIGKDHCDWITFTLEDNTPIPDDFLLKRGFRMKEKSYLMEI